MNRRYRTRRNRTTPGLDVTTFLNLMVVLIPFLLISAVFSRVTILELSVPVSSGEASADTPQFAIEVIVRETGLEIGNGMNVEAALPKKDGAYDLALLSQMLMRLKAVYPEKEDATILLEPDIAYDHLVQVMDVVRGSGLQNDPAQDTQARDDNPAATDPQQRQEMQAMVLFPEISIGDAP